MTIRTVRRRASPAADVVGRAVLDARTRLGWTQRDLAQRATVSQASVWRLESGRGDELRLGVVVALVDALGGRFQPTLLPPALPEPRQSRDVVHARLVAYTARRLRREGWDVALEVELRTGRATGWIDVLAVRATDAACLVVEAKSELVDIGGALRQLGWYARDAWSAARARWWQPRTVTAALLLLDTQLNMAIVTAHAELMHGALPGRAPELLAWLRGTGPPVRGSALAMVDPLSRRDRWVRATVPDGRRTPAAHVDLAGFRRTITAPGRPRAGSRPPSHAHGAEQASR